MASIHPAWRSSLLPCRRRPPPASPLPARPPVPTGNPSGASPGLNGVSDRLSPPTPVIADPATPATQVPQPSTSYLSNISGYSAGSASAGTVDLGADELAQIAHTMVIDGYTQRMVQAFNKHGGEQDRALETWFAELDINWVLQLRERKEFWQQAPLYGGISSLRLQELAERWIRALTVIIASIKELAVAVHDAAAVRRFGKASISAMLVFVDAIVYVHSTEKLQTILHMYICISNASYDMLKMDTISPGAQWIFDEIAVLVERKEDTLIGSMSATMWHVKSILMKGDDELCPTMDYKEGNKNVERLDYSWSIEIMQGGGDVHRITRLMVDYIVLMRKSQISTQHSARSQNIGKLHDLIDDTMDYLKDLLLTKSKLCSDPSLGYLFLLNNYYFLLQVSEPSLSSDLHLKLPPESDLVRWCAHHLKLTPECEKYIDSYLDVSWGHVLSCIQKSNFHGPLRCRFKTSALAKFQSDFYKTYRTQKFWKVPDPQLRSLLRERIRKRVISGYCDFLQEYPELEKHVSGGSNSPKIYEEMLGQLFEG
uniref:Uncharacterized protein n=1 Tax=Avena sativa TaxID=4498 RepID=A0ACD5YUU6_AVESA